MSAEWIFLDLAADSAALWRTCPVHEESRDPETKICDGCAAEAKPACTYCAGSGTTSHWSAGLEWPERCRCRRSWPHSYTPDPEDYQP